MGNLEESMHINLQILPTIYDYTSLCSIFYHYLANVLTLITYPL